MPTVLASLHVDRDGRVTGRVPPDVPLATTRRRSRCRRSIGQRATPSSTFRSTTSPGTTRFPCDARTFTARTGAERCCSWTPAFLATAAAEVMPSPSPSGIECTVTTTCRPMAGSVRSVLRRLMEHLLKPEHAQAPAHAFPGRGRASRGWRCRHPARRCRPRCRPRRGAWPSRRHPGSHRASSVVLPHVRGPRHRGAAEGG